MKPEDLLPREKVVETPTLASPDRETRGRYLVVEVAGVLYALAESWVRATLPAVAGIHGDVPFHGKLYPVLELRRLFGFPTPQGEVQVVLLEVAQRLADQRLADQRLADQRLAVVVDHELGWTVLEEQRMALPWNFKGRERNWFPTLALDGEGRLLALLDAGGLLSGGPAAEAAHGAPGEKLPC